MVRVPPEFQVVTSGRKLVDAIQRGDERAIGEAVHGILSGAWAVTAVAVGAGAGMSAAIGATLYWYYLGYRVVLDIVDLWKSFKKLRVREAVRRLTDDAMKVAAEGQKMSAAWWGFFEAKNGGTPLHEKAAAQFEREMKERLKNVTDGLRAVHANVTSSRDDTVGGYRDLREEFGEDVIGRIRMPPDEPGRLAALRNDVFAALDRVGKPAMERYGK
jgi:hypothetical protein